jgi:hypothetical protein
VSGVAGPESLAAVERTADLLTAKAGAKDPSAIPSICRINAVTQNISGIILSKSLVFFFSVGIKSVHGTVSSSKCGYG